MLFMFFDAVLGLFTSVIFENQYVNISFYNVNKTHLYKHLYGQNYGLVVFLLLLQI